jgi:hypothetical protein
MLIALHAFIKEPRRPAGRSGDCAAEAEGDGIMTKKKNPHIGSSLESWLDQAGLREEVTVAAVKSVIAHQLAAEMKKKSCPKSEWLN